jgi:hypothetical protein
MALFKFQNLNKHGNLRTRIVHSPTSQFKYKCEGLGKFVNVQRFKYEYHHSHISPQMQVRKGERFIMPGNQKVHSETTFDDIVWIQPQPKKRTEPIIKINVSSSNGSKYQTKYFPDSGNYQCNCPGTWRAKDRRCKHIKALEIEVNKK